MRAPLVQLLAAAAVVTLLLAVVALSARDRPPPLAPELEPQAGATK